ncbi:MAG: serine/threonine-protein kinase [Kofleriaceae bacterium]
MTAGVQVGEMIAGKYRLEHEIGAGGMGVVYAATHVRLDQRVALKFLLADAAQNPEMVERFFREARAAVKVQSEHVARVIDIGDREGTPYIVMEYLEGEDLEGIVDTFGPLPVTDAVRYVLQSCEALAEVHVQGIVHRDIKPANLFLAARADGTCIVKLLDFGISKSAPAWIAGAKGPALTQTSAVIGSPRYMSPEQLRSSRDVDARADVWALGVTLFELLGGNSPFASGTMPEVCASILKDEPGSLAQLRPEIPAALEAVIRRCLAKDPAKRWSNVAELATALRPFGPPGSEISVERTTGVMQQAALPPGSRAHPSRPPPSTPVPSAADRSDQRADQARTSASGRPKSPTERASATGPVEITLPPLTDDEHERRYLARLGGNRELVPRLVIDAQRLTGLSLDHRAGFLMSCIDGQSSLDDILCLSGMTRLETLRLVCELADQRVIVFVKQGS